jgi:hypothetical protein
MAGNGSAVKPRKTVLTAAALAALTTTAPAAAAQRASCNVTPQPLEAIQQGTLTATGLPAAPVELYTYFVYDGRTETYGDTDITPAPDGTWTQPAEWEESGKAEYRFILTATGALLASCNVTVK